MRTAATHKVSALLKNLHPVKTSRPGENKNNTDLAFGARSYEKIDELLHSEELEDDAIVETLRKLKTVLTSQESRLITLTTEIPQRLCEFLVSTNQQIAALSAEIIGILCVIPQGLEVFSESEAILSLSEMLHSKNRTVRINAANSLLIITNQFHGPDVVVGVEGCIDLIADSIIIPSLEETICGILSNISAVGSAADVLSSSHTLHRLMCIAERFEKNSKAAFLALQTIYNCTRTQIGKQQSVLNDLVHRLYHLLTSTIELSPLPVTDGQAITLNNIIETDNQIQICIPDGEEVWSSTTVQIGLSDGYSPFSLRATACGILSLLLLTNEGRKEAILEEERKGETMDELADTREDRITTSRVVKVLELDLKATQAKVAKEDQTKQHKKIVRVRKEIPQEEQDEEHEAGEEEEREEQEGLEGEGEGEDGEKQEGEDGEQLNVEEEEQTERKGDPTRVVLLQDERGREEEMKLASPPTKQTDTPIEDLDNEQADGEGLDAEGDHEVPEGEHGFEEQGPDEGEGYEEGEEEGAMDGEAGQEEEDDGGDDETQTKSGRGTVRSSIAQDEGGEGGEDGNEEWEDVEQLIEYEDQEDPEKMNDIAYAVPLKGIEPAAETPPVSEGEQELVPPELPIIHTLTSILLSCEPYSSGHAFYGLAFLCQLSVGKRAVLRVMNEEHVNPSLIQSILINARRERRYL
ncbi:hypothetical protein BLNAU_12754 [Blattamonas nauphoetae]|uniref:Uncharacterized protein n=1 Tax=Blattamonas nauphoetae TaxID=2049346 RepID=A0ABQ9XNH2_9EUKA|nr:hypothetical protein BLNAU_12754 [Blattamonas nauphoetae]